MTIELLSSDLPEAGTTETGAWLLISTSDAADLVDEDTRGCHEFLPDRTMREGFDVTRQ